MICIGIPVCRPLYKRFLDKLTSFGTQSGGYKKQSGSGGGRRGAGVDSKNTGPRYGLRTFGGSTMPGASRWEPEGDTERERDTGDDTGSDTISMEGGKPVKGKKSQKSSNKKLKMDLELGINGPITETTAVAGGDVYPPDNGSQEEILGGDRRVETQAQGEGRRRSDMETAKGQGKGHVAPKASIQVTEEWRVDRS
jgi:hypothetical protein